MPEYKVNSESLGQTASRIKATSERILGELEAVIKDVGATKDFWTGNASSTYEDLMQRWKSSADKVRGDLDRTTTALEKAAEEYGRTEEHQVSRFGSAG